MVEELKKRDISNVILLVCKNQNFKSYPFCSTSASNEMTLYANSFNSVQTVLTLYVNDDNFSHVESITKHKH